MTDEATPLPLTRIQVMEIKQGDIFPGPSGWTALSDAQNLHDEYCSVQVQFRDGGIEIREWQNPLHEIEVERPGSTPA